MKTAISISDALFKKAEETAKKLGISRSSLFCRAIQEYLENHIPADITEKLNQVYTKESSDRDPIITRLQVKTLEKENW